MKKYIVFTLLCLLASISWASAQTKVTGKVIDSSDSSPVVAASVAVKGSSTGTMTDENGNYSLTVPANATLVFSYLGYISAEEKVNERTVINVSLKPNATLLNEVVVTASGNRPARNLTSAITQIKGGDIANTNQVNAINAIQGKVAGVQINMGNSGPQSAQRIIIRGNTSLKNNNQPIFVIDGVIVDNSTTGPDKWGSGMDFGNEIKNLNSDDYETMTILKGSAATALYGSKAANGVIMITTKKGRKTEGVGINFSHYQVWDNIYGGPNFQNQYGDGISSVMPADRNLIPEEINFGPKFDGKPVKMNGLDENWSAIRNNWRDAMRNGTQANTNVAIQGGSENNSFRLSYSHLQSNGQLMNNEFGRNSFLGKFTQKITKFLDAEASFSFVESNTLNPTPQGGGGNPLYDFIGLPRNYNTTYWLDNYKNADGSGRNLDDWTGYDSKMWSWFENTYEQKDATYRGYLNVNFHLTDWLTFVTRADIYRINTDNQASVLGNGGTGYSGSGYTITTSHKDNYTITGRLTAKKSLNDFNATASVSGEQWDTKYGYLKSWTDGGLKVPGQFDLSNSVNPAKTEGKNISEKQRINSAYGWINLDWKNQLFLDLTGRNDWSSTLTYPDGSGNNSYFYPSVAAAWVFSDTFRDNLTDKVTFAKIRASLARTGQGTKPYLTSIGYYQFETNMLNPNTNTSYPLYQFDSNSLRNLNLKPEITQEMEFGGEARFFNDRLGFDLAWYKKNSFNQIIALTQPKESGVESKYINAGNIQNTGIELAINGRPIDTRNISWDLSWNYTRNRNKVIELTPGVDMYELEAGNLDTYSYAEVGKEYGVIYTPYAYKRYQAVDGSGKPIAHPNNGQPILLNTSGTAYKRSGKMTPVGKTQPDFMMGFNSNFRYKEFTLNTVLDASFGGDVVSGTYNYGMAYGSLSGTLPYRDQASGGLERIVDGASVYDGVIPDGVYDNGVKINGTDVSGWTFREAYEKGLVKPVPAWQHYYYKHSWGNGIREEAVFERSYVSLREVSLWWRMPSKWARKVYAQNINIGLMCRNVAYLYNSLPENIHPEGLYSNRTTAFVEVGGQPYARQFSFKVDLTF